MYIAKKRKLGRGVAVVGAGMSKFGVRTGMTNRDLFFEAFVDMMNSVDKPIEPGDIDALYVGNAGSEVWEAQSAIAVICADVAGITPKPALKVEDACASASVAIRQGVMGIASGLYSVVLAGGTERMNVMSTDWNTMSIALAADTLFEGTAGFSFAGLYAALATAHMNKYGTVRRDLMAVTIKNHENGALNPKGHLPMTIRDIMKTRITKCQEKRQPIPKWDDEMEFLSDPAANPLIAWPSHLFDCCPVSDGAACVLLVAEDIAKSFTDNPIYIVGSGQASDWPLHGRKTLTSLDATKIAARQAYDMAEVRPPDIKIAEVHDCFTIAEILAIADLGFFREGEESARAASDGRTARNGEKPINTSGGLKSKGHPVGASGAAMTVEIFKQMRGEAGQRQVPKTDVNLALTHNVGAHGTTCVVHIYERR